MLTIKRIDEVVIARVSELSVADDQLPFVGQIDEILSKMSNNNFHVIVLDEAVVGFFNIDTNYFNSYDSAMEEEFG